MTDAFGGNPEEAAALKNKRYHVLVPGQEGSGRKEYFSRVTTFVKAIADNIALERWKLRKVVEGIASDETLYLLAAGIKDFTSKEGKEKLDEIIALAQERAGANEGSRFGTAAHALNDLVDTRDPAGLARVPTWLRPKYVNLARAYERHRLAVIPEFIERRVFVSKFQLVGTLDRILLDEVSGELIIGDLKGLALTTPLATPDGWTTMGAVRAGDEVFDAFGQPCRVIAKSEIKRIGTYVVRFDDGSEIVCDSEHIWWTQPDGAAQPAARPISEVIETLVAPTGQRHHRVPVAGTLDLPEVALPIDPYVLGVWLGNGDSSGGGITSMPDLFEVLERNGHPMGATTIDPRGNKAVRRTILGLMAKLRAAGLIGHKEIPNSYLRAGSGQRLALLQGLMDTDGTWNKPRRAVAFTSVRKALAEQVAELATSLGQRVNLTECQGFGFGKKVTFYQVAFTPVGINPFQLPRKAEQAAASTKSVLRSTRRIIVSVEPGPDVETACIAVDSPTQTYLAGERMIPTHNTQAKLWGYQDIAIQLALYANADWMWNPDLQVWEPMPEVRKDVALLLWMPRTHPSRENDAVEIEEVRIDRAWEFAAQTCADARAWRTEGAKLGMSRPLPNPPASVL